MGVLKMFRFLRLVRLPTTQAMIFYLAATSLAFCEEAFENSTEHYVTTASGLQYHPIRQNNGAKTQAGMKVTLHGIGTYSDGREFWNSLKDNQPFTFITETESVIKGAEEAVSLMAEGERYLFILPADIAYGAKGKGDIPPNTTLYFDYEIMSTTKATSEEIAEANKKTSERKAKRKAQESAE